MNFKQIKNYVKDWTRYLVESENAFTFGLVMITICIGAFFFIPTPGITIATAKGFFMSLAAVLGILITGIAVLRRGSISVSNHPLFLVLGGISLVTLIAGLFSPNIQMSLVGYGFETTTWFFTILFLVFVFIAYKSAKGYQRTTLALGGLFLVFGLMSVVHILRFFIGPSFMNLGILASSTSSLIGSWSDFAMFSGLILLISVVTLQISGIIKIARTIVLVISVIAVILLLVINIPSIWVVLSIISLLLTLYFFAFAFWDSKKKVFQKDRTIPWYVLALFLVSLLGLFFGGHINSLARKYENIGWNDLRPSLTSTMRVAQQSLTHNLATGHGPNTFNLGWNLSKPPVLSGTQLGSVDYSFGYSFITTQIATNGVLGAIMWILFLLVTGFIILKRISLGFDNWTDRYFISVVSSAIIFLIAMSLVAIPGTYLLIILAVLLGIFIANTDTSQKFTFSFIDDPRASFFGILTTTIIIGGVFFVGYLMIQRSLSFVHDARGVSLLGQNRNQQAISAINRAINLADFDIYRTQLAGLALTDASRFLASISDSNKQAVSQKVEQVLGIALGNAKAATVSNPSNYKNWLVLGNVYKTAVVLGVAEAEKLAAAAYSEALARNPNDATMHLAFANLAITSKDTATALAKIQESIDQYPTKSAYMLRAQIYISQQKWDSALTSLKQAAAMDQNDPSTYIYLGIAYEKTGDVATANQIFDSIKKRFTDGADVITQARKAFSSGQVTPSENSTLNATSTDTVIPAPKTPVAPKPKR